MDEANWEASSASCLAALIEGSSSSVRGGRVPNQRWLVLMTLSNPSSQSRVVHVCLWFIRLLPRYDVLSINVRAVSSGAVCEAFLKLSLPPWDFVVNFMPERVLMEFEMGYHDT